MNQTRLLQARTRLNPLGQAGGSKQRYVYLILYDSIV